MRCRHNAGNVGEDAENRLKDAGHGRVMPDVDAVNACTHAMSAETVPGMDFPV